MSKYLIINCDDFGQCAAANRAIIHLLEEGKVSSATVMPPAPAFEEAAAWCRKQREPKVGLHLTLTSEFAEWRWRGLTGAASLHDGSGFLHMTVEDVEKKAATRDVRAEIRAQFEAVRKAGVNITHVDNHMGSLYGLATGRSHLPYVFWQCSKRGLPFRVPRYVHAKDRFLASIPDAQARLRKVSALADALGVAIPDYLLSHPYGVQEGETYASFKQSIIEKLYDLPEGVSETYIHPADDDADMRRKIPHWEKRVWEYRLMLDDDLAYALRDAKVTLTDYRFLKANRKRSRWAGAWRLFR